VLQEPSVSPGWSTVSVTTVTEKVRSGTPGLDRQGRRHADRRISAAKKITENP
jgi:hypothetical protein